MSRYKLGWRSSVEAITEVSAQHVFAAQLDTGAPMASLGLMIIYAFGNHPNRLHLKNCPI